MSDASAASTWRAAGIPAEEKREYNEHQKKIAGNPITSARF
jgi:hypothetical protein